ncbi:MAG TPA: GAF domain-containing protein [Polyangiaceae bacterium]
MTDGPDDLGDYVRKVQQNTQEYLRGLINENEKLCALIHTLEGELDRERKDRLRIEERIATIDAERRAYLTKYEEVEAQNTNVSNLYVATLRVHGSIGRSDVLGAIHEIIINLIGCEELAVLEINSTGSTLVLSSSFGIESGPYQRIALGDGIIGDCAVTRRTYVAGDEWDGTRTALDDNLTACIPLIVEGVVTGAIAIFRLLDHKPKLEPIDHELFALLGTHAAMALHYTTLVERLGGRRSLPPTRSM